MESKDEWIAAAEALRLLKPALGEYEAQKAICKRAHSGLIRARAAPYTGVLQDDKVPKEFWWAEGQAALTQNWQTSDFETYDPRGEVRYRAFAVSFLRADIEKMIPPAAHAPPAAKPGRRGPTDHWEDLIIDACFRYFRGDLQPKKQADVERAMQEWLSERGLESAESTIRERAKKVWLAIERDREADR